MIHYSPTSLSYGVDWHIKSTPVYRILDNTQWLKNFFEKGEIQVSCFEVFRNYKDELRGDISEGTGNVVFNMDKSTNVLGYETGSNAFILSTTKELNDQVLNDFNGKCAIKINDPTMFGLELSKKLPFVNSGLEGNCDYVESKINFLERHVGTEFLSDFIKGKRDPEFNHSFRALTMGMELFAKHRKYCHQREYRFIWFGEAKITENYIVYCPELTQYCEPVEI